MTDVLLTHSYHLPFDPKQVRKMQPYPPLGTLYAAAHLRARGFSVAVFDTMLRDPAEFTAVLEEHRPKIVAIYEDDFNFLTKMCLTRMRELAFEMANIASRKGAVVIGHGSDAADHAPEYMGNGYDYLVSGEGEQALAELARAVLSGNDPRAIAGVFYRALNNRIRSNPPVRPSSRLDDLAFPARDLINLEPYRRAWTEAHGYFSLNLISSRGCPFRCNWCAKPIFGDEFHLRSAASVAAEMRQLKNTYGAEHLWFADDIFALSKRWQLEFAREVECRDAAVPFKAQCRADLIDDAAARALKQAGAAEIWMGVESGSQKVLNAMDKGLSVEEVIAARDHLREEGIRACYFLQFGYPGETWDDIRRTVSLVRQTRPDDIGVSLSYPLPKTRFYERVNAQLGRKRNWRDSDDLCVMFKGAYTDVFYRAVRDALHAEVESWREAENDSGRLAAQLWRRVEELEPRSRNADPTFAPDEPSTGRPMQLFPVDLLACKAGEV